LFPPIVPSVLHISCLADKLLNLVALIRPNRPGQRNQQQNPTAWAYLGMLDLAYIPMEQFALKWRFTDARYRVLPPHHLAELQPLAPESARRIWDLTLPLHRDVPFTDGFFRTVESTPLDSADPEAVRAVRKWLFRRRLPFRARVLLSYQPGEAIATTWKMVVKYWEDLWYPGSDDLTVVDGSLTWALLLWHEEQAFFGDNREVPADRPAVEPADAAERQEG